MNQIGYHKLFHKTEKNCKYEKYCPVKQIGNRSCKNFEACPIWTYYEKWGFENRLVNNTKGKPTLEEIGTDRLVGNCKGVSNYDIEILGVGAPMIPVGRVNNKGVNNEVE